MTQPPAALSVYGKLPVYAEYVKIRCMDGVGRGLRDWIDAGFQQGGARLGTRWRVLEMGQNARDGGEPVVATVRDSRDASGRAFAFSCYATGAVSLESGSIVDVTRDALRVWENLARFDQALAREGNIDGVRSAALGWDFGQRCGRGAGPEPLQFDQWAEALLGGEDQGERLLQLLWELRQALRVVGTNPDGLSEGRMPALRLPLSEAADPGQQVLLWVRALHSGGVRPARPRGSGLQLYAVAFPESASGHAAMFAFPRPLRGSDYRLLPVAGDGILQPVPFPVPKADANGYAVFRASVEAMLAQSIPADEALSRIPLGS